MLGTIERSLVYPAPSFKRGNWNTRWVDKEDVFFESYDARSKSAVKLHGWFVPHPEAKHVVVYSHGQSEHVANLLNVVGRLQDALQASVLVYDYRGYGKSEGTPSEFGCIADGLAAQQWLAERTGTLPEETVVVGRSLGGAVAVAMAAERGAKMLVLENTFSRLTDVAAYKFPWLPVRRFMKNRFDSIERIVGYHGPLLQTHGTRDRIAPALFARQLFSACPSEDKRFFTVRGGRHYDAPPVSFYDYLADFLDSLEDSPANGAGEPEQEPISAK